eukprot:1723649-Lingulodinium_polyedra.AAC.1
MQLCTAGGPPPAVTRECIGVKPAAPSTPSTLLDSQPRPPAETKRSAAWTSGPPITGTARTIGAR